MERGCPTLISTYPIAAVVNTLYKAGHGEVRTKASVEQQHRSQACIHCFPHVLGVWLKSTGIFLTAFCVFFPSHLLSSPLSCSLLVVTKIQSHMVGSTPPSPLRYAPCIFIARIIQNFLPSPTRVDLCPPTLCLALSTVGVF